MREQQQPGREERLPGEVTETYRRPAEEIVEVYRQPVPGEVVERYVRPLPGRRTPPAARPGNRHRGVWIFVVCMTVVLGIAAGAGAWVLFFSDRAAGNSDLYGMEEMASGEEEISIPTYPWGEGVTLDIRQDRGQSLTAREIYQKVSPAVVTVLAQDGEKGALGSGVIFRSDGYILTNYHVLQGSRDCTVMLYNDWAYEGRYVAGDAEHDLAVLKVEAVGLPTAEFGDSDQLAVGDPVYAIGNPMGMELRGTMTEGIVSAVDRDVTVDGRVMNLIQTDASLNVGNSGGPLIDQYGQVVGIVTLKFRTSYFSAEGLGFAIPSAAIDRMADDLLTFGELRPEPLLGVTVLSPAVQVEAGTRGLQVRDVTPGGAADRAGVRAGDVILSAAGTELADSRDLLRVRRQLYVGDQLDLTLWRDGERLDVTLTLDEPAE